MTGFNPIIRTDFPDPDVIRVADTYYMVSTTMHFMPGGVILRSYDLVNWEVASYIYDRLDDTPAQELKGEQHIYGKGMWAGSIRFHKGKFYVCFVANDTHKTCLYQSADIKGPWKKQNIDGFYHDCSLLFDDDDRVYIVYGNTEIFLTELDSDLTGPKPGGLNRLIIKEKENVTLGYEGSHIYKVNGKYYLFLIHWLADGSKRRVEACFAADSLEGEFTGKNVFDDDIGFHNMGIAQGGIVDTPHGKWYSVMFQDHGAVGRVPVLVPVHWENDFPVFGVNGKAPTQITTESTRPDYVYAPLVGSDDFGYTRDSLEKIHLKDFWEWNHTPDDSLWSVTERPGHYRVKSGKLSSNMTQAVNTLTQRMMLPSCEAGVTLDGSGLKDGDYAGICALQGCYGLIALTKGNGKNYLVMLAKENGGAARPKNSDYYIGKEFARVPVEGSKVTLKVRGNFANMTDNAEFFYKSDSGWKKFGITHRLYFKLDHFAGCRFGLFLYSTKQTGGVADFSDFTYDYPID